MSSVKRLPSIGEIARRLGRSEHQVAYVIRTRQIEPVGLAGIIRIFSGEAVETIAKEFVRMDAATTSHSGRPVAPGPDMKHAGNAA